MRISVERVPMYRLKYFNSKQFLVKTPFFVIGEIGDSGDVKEAIAMALKSEAFRDSAFYMEQPHVVKDANVREGLIEIDCVFEGEEQIPYIILVEVEDIPTASINIEEL